MGPNILAIMAWYLWPGMVMFWNICLPISMSNSCAWSCQHFGILLIGQWKRCEHESAKAKQITVLFISQITTFLSSCTCNIIMVEPFILSDCTGRECVAWHIPCQCDHVTSSSLSPSSAACIWYQPTTISVMVILAIVIEFERVSVLL